MPDTRHGDEDGQTTPPAHRGTFKKVSKLSAPYLYRCATISALGGMLAGAGLLLALAHCLTMATADMVMNMYRCCWVVERSRGDGNGGMRSRGRQDAGVSSRCHPRTRRELETSSRPMLERASCNSFLPVDRALAACGRVHLCNRGLVVEWTVVEAVFLTPPPTPPPLPPSYPATLPPPPV